jgi:hypothetical protein
MPEINRKRILQYLFHPKKDVIVLFSILRASALLRKIKPVAAIVFKIYHTKFTG